MEELVYLQEYRDALRKLESRKSVGRWQGLRFDSLDFFDLFTIPPICGADDSIYIKVDDAEAVPWPNDLSMDFEAYLIFVERPRSFGFDFPVVKYTERSEE